MRFHLTQLLNDLGVPALRFGDAWPAAIYDPESDAVFLGEVCLGTEDDEVLCCEIKRVYPDLDEPVLALRAEPEEGSWRVVFFSLGGKPVSVPADFAVYFAGVLMRELLAERVPDVAGLAFKILRVRPPS